VEEKYLPIVSEIQQEQRYTNWTANREGRYIDRQVGSGGWSKEGVDRFVQLNRLVMKDRTDPRRVKLEREVLEYQEDQVATTARKGRKRSRTQMQNPESRRLE
jgi:16S rRNA C1402 N4-methylase RsmH